MCRRKGRLSVEGKLYRIWWAIKREAINGGLEKGSRQAWTVVNICWIVNAVALSPVRER